MGRTDIEWLKYLNEFHYGNHPEINTAVKRAIEALERTRWIPLEDRLPGVEDSDGHGKVLVHFSNGHVDVWHWEIVQTRFVSDYLPGLTHWLSIPRHPYVREESGHWDGIAPEDA